MSKMAFQVVFSAKNVTKFIFWLLVAPNLINEGEAIMAPSPSIHNILPELHLDRVKSFFEKYQESKKSNVS